MANSKIIIVEGPQGVGKTTITDYIRHGLAYTNLYRLSGHSDSSPTGKKKSETMYKNLMKYIKTLENTNINLLFDRTFFTEEIYCRLGFKEYSFTDVYNELLKELDEMDFDIHYITLYLSDGNEFKERLVREGKADLKYAHFTLESSLKQQNAYLELADEIANTTKNIKVHKIDNSRSLEEVQNELKEILDI